MAKLFKNLIFLPRTRNFVTVRGMFLTFYLLFPALAGAALVPCGSAAEPCTLCHFFVLIDGIIDFLIFNLGLPLAFLSLVIGGVMFIISGDNEQKRSQAKGVITGVFFGLLIVFVAWVIIEMIMNYLTNPAAFPWPWDQINCTP